MIFGLLNVRYLITATSKVETDELERIWKEAGVAYFDLLFQHLSPETEEIQWEVTVRVAAVRTEIRNSELLIMKEELKVLDGDVLSFLLKLQYSDPDTVFLFPKDNQADTVYTLASVGVPISVFPRSHVI
jgi:hypothetical protein